MTKSESAPPTLVETLRRVTSDLAQRGEARTRDIQGAARERADRSARNWRDLVRLIQKEIRHQRALLQRGAKDDADTPTPR